MSPKYFEYECEFQVARGENVVRATGARRMRRRPAAAGASSSRAAEETVVQGLFVEFCFPLIAFFKKKNL